MLYTIADNSPAIFEELQQKHPASSTIPLAETMGLPLITVSEEEIVRAIRSFPNDSAGGPDGLRPQHLKDMTGPITNGGAQALISARSQFVTVVLQVKIHMSIRSFFFGASLTALTKRDSAYCGGLHPAPAGCQGCRLQGEGQDGKLGYGVRGGAEAAVHAARLYMQDLQHRCVLKPTSGMPSTL